MHSVLSCSTLPLGSLVDLGYPGTFFGNSRGWIIDA